MKAEFSHNASQLNIFAVNKYPDPDEATDFFIQFALHYLLSGKSLIEICEYNSSVARNLGKYNVNFKKYGFLFSLK